MAGKPIPAHIHLLMAVIAGFVGFVVIAGLTAPPYEAAPLPVDPPKVLALQVEIPRNTKKEQPKSAALQAYEDAAEPIDQKLAVANIVAECQIQDQDWYLAATRRLEEYRAGPEIGPLFSRLTDIEKEQARRFDQSVVDEMRKFHVGGDPLDVACRKIAALPFPYRADAVEP